MLVCLQQSPRDDAGPVRLAGDAPDPAGGGRAADQDPGAGPGVVVPLPSVGAAQRGVRPAGAQNARRHPRAGRGGAGMKFTTLNKRAMAL